MSGRDRALSLAARAWDALPARARWRALHATQARFLVGVVGLLTDPAGRVLLLEHRFRTPWRWGLPGGFVGRGETLTGALARELGEEVGLAADLDLAPFDAALTPGAAHLTVTLTGAVRDAPERVVPRRPAEILGGGFHAPGDLPGDLHPDHRALVLRFLARPRG